MKLYAESNCTTRDSKKLCLRSKWRKKLKQKHEKKSNLQIKRKKQLKRVRFPQKSTLSQSLNPQLVLWHQVCLQGKSLENAKEKKRDKPKQKLKNN